jgi:hypothetical protein
MSTASAMIHFFLNIKIAVRAYNPVLFKVGSTIRTSKKHVRRKPL